MYCAAFSLTYNMSEPASSSRRRTHRGSLRGPSLLCAPTCATTTAHVLETATWATLAVSFSAALRTGVKQSLSNNASVHFWSDASSRASASSTFTKRSSLVNTITRSPAMDIRQMRENTYMEGTYCCLTRRACCSESPLGQTPGDGVSTSSMIQTRNLIMGMKIKNATRSNETCLEQDAKTSLTVNGNYHPNSAEGPSRRHRTLRLDTNHDFYSSLGLAVYYQRVRERRK